MVCSVHFKMIYGYHQGSNMKVNIKANQKPFSTIFACTSFSAFSLFEFPISHFIMANALYSISYVVLDFYLIFHSRCLKNGSFNIIFSYFYFHENNAKRTI